MYTMVQRFSTPKKSLKYIFRENLETPAATLKHYEGSVIAILLPKNLPFVFLKCIFLATALFFIQ